MAAQCSMFTYTCLLDLFSLAQTPTSVSMSDLYTLYNLYYYNCKSSLCFRIMYMQWCIMINKCVQINKQENVTCMTKEIRTVWPHLFLHVSPSFKLTCMHYCKCNGYTLKLLYIELCFKPQLLFLYFLWKSYQTVDKYSLWLSSFIVIVVYWNKEVKQHPYI